MDTRAKLLRARVALRSGLIASEDWQPSYKRDRKTFRALTLGEAKLESVVAEYLNGLDQRAPSYVDWFRLPGPLLADAGPVLNNDAEAWKLEQQLLTAAVLDIIADLVATGAIAGENIYGIPMGYTTLDEEILRAARTRVGQLVKGVTETTRDLIRESIRQSIAAGEDITAAKARLSKVILNPVRAELIAHTESVNAYQIGLSTYGKATGANTKTWDALPGACKICSPLSGKTIGIDELFVLANGHEVEYPSAHPRCRCGIIYNY